MPGKTERELTRLRRLKVDGDTVNSNSYRQWYEATRLAVESTYGRDSPEAGRFSDIRFTPAAVFSGMSDTTYSRALDRGIESARRMLEVYIDDVAFTLEEPETPVADPSTMHPWVSGPALPLWTGGHFRQAVQEAARSVDLQLQLKVGEYGTGAALMSEAFSPNPPKDGRPRLRFDGYTAATEQWKNAHAGAGQFGAGCMMRIRNLYVHGDEPSDREALEALSALSLLARWIDQARVDRAPED